jgi:hypothetical protein
MDCLRPSAGVSPPCWPLWRRGGEVTGLVGYLTLFFLGHFSPRGVGSTAWLLLLAGMIGVGGYLALYRGLES